MTSGWAKNGYDESDGEWSPFAAPDSYAARHGLDPGTNANSGNNISREAFDAAREAGIGKATLDPALAGRQDEFLRAIGHHAFGGDEPGSAQAEEAIHTSPYAATAGATRRVGQTAGGQLGAALTTTGQAQIQGQQGAQGFADAQDARRMGAVNAYGGAAGQMRDVQGGLARFNAAQEGDLVHQLYQMMYGLQMTEQQRKDAEKANNMRGYEQAITGAMGAVGKPAGG